MIKVHILFEFKEGPWGGGNQFLKSLKKYLHSMGTYDENVATAQQAIYLLEISHFAQKSFPTAQITSIDIATEAVNHLKEKGRNVILGDILTADLPNGQFDVVYMREVMEYLYEPVKYMKKVRELLKKGGLFFYTTGNTDEIHDLKNWSYIRPAGHINYFNPRSVKELFRKSGLKCYPRELLDKSLKELLKYCQVKIGLRTQQLPLGYRSSSSTIRTLFIQACFKNNHPRKRYL